MKHLLAAFFLATATLHAQDWQPIQVPGDWESQIGDYDGFAWYRCVIHVPESWRGSRMLLTVRSVDDVDEAYVNGEKVGANGGMPPLFAKPSSDVRRPAVIDPDQIRFGHANLIAFRVYDHGGAGGILEGPIQLSRLEDAIDLSGTWQFITGDQKEHAHWPKQELTSSLMGPKAAGHRGIVPADKAGRDRDLALVRKRFEGNKNVHSNIEGKGPPLNPEAARAALKPGDDFILETVLAEPTITQPLYIEFDARGRLWVTEYIQYPDPAGLKVLTWDNHLRSVFDAVPPPPPYEKPEHQKFVGRDRISIHEDTNGDGSFDSHKVFADGLNIVTSTCQGHQGVWVMNPPYLLFYPDADGNDVPDSAPTVHLSGFGLEDTHSVANSLKWGPDGWLYGATGSTVTARIRVTAKPEQAPHAFFGQNIWRYHPHTHAFELFAEGGWNTFGVDFDAQGRLYSGTNGNMQVVYFVQGGFYQKSFGKHGPHTNPHAFDYFYGIPIEGQAQRMVNQWVPYAGGAFPGYESHFFGVNCLANRVPVLALEPDGSTFRSRELPAAVESEDVWFRPIHATTGPDGHLYISDFYDARITHVDPRDNWDRDHGRIYRLRHREGKPHPHVDLTKLTNTDLLKQLDHPNQWNRNTARRLLTERRDPNIPAQLREKLDLDRLWTLHQLGAFDETTAFLALRHDDVHVRLWAIRLLGDRKESLSPALFEILHEAARASTEAEFISQFASSLQRFPTDQALPILAQILLGERFTNDAYIPSQLWWALETHLSKAPEAVLAWLSETPLWHTPIMETKLASLITRQLASNPSAANLKRLARLLETAPSTITAPLIQGLEAGLQGITLTAIPPELDRAFGKLTSQSPQSLELLLLGLRLKSAKARQAALTQIQDSQTKTGTRLQLINALTEPPAAVLITVATSDAPLPLRRSAIHALRRSQDTDIPSRLLAVKQKDLQSSVLTVLAGRRSWSAALLGAIEAKTIPITALTLDQTHMIRSHSDPALTQRLTKLTTSPVSTDKQERLLELRTLLASTTGEATRGKDVFTQVCAACHQLFDQGMAIGPDLTGYDRRDRDFLLTAIIDPNLALREEYELTTLTLRPAEGSEESTVLSGFVKALTDQQLTLQDLTGQRTTISTRSILKKENSPTSLMPEGLLETLTEQQVVDLFAYLQQTTP